MVTPLLSLMLIVGASPCEHGCGAGAAWSPYFCPHRAVDDCPGREVYAQTSPFCPHPAKTAWMFRYTYKYGINYSKPTDFRSLYDYPWYKRGDSLPRPAVSAFSERVDQPVFEQEGWVPVETIPEEAGVKNRGTETKVEQTTYHERGATTSVHVAREALPMSRLLR